MSWTPNAMEIAAVLKLSGPERFEYCIKRVADHEVVWSLWQDGGWNLMGDCQGREVVPIWPHANYASACAVNAWTGSEARPIPLDLWLSKWIPGMERDGRLVAVFPSPADKGVVVTPKTLEQAIRAECEQYE